MMPQTVDMADCVGSGRQQVSRNSIQFQDGLSLSAFTKRYGTEAQCEAAVAAWRWPSGFICPNCGGTAHGIVGKRRLYECHACHRQTSLKSGTIFAKSLVPLTKWFQCMWLLTQSKGSVATLELARQLDLKWDSAWLMRQKLMQVMAEREAGRKLSGRIEVDDALLGGRQGVADGGKQGRGGSNKIPFVSAVETRDGRPRRVQFIPVATHSQAEIARIAAIHFEPGSTIVSDGHACFPAVTAAGCIHEQRIASRSDVPAMKIPAFRWVNTVLGNLKTAIAGTFKSIRRRYAPRYLAEFQYRFNRRQYLQGMLDRLATVAVQTGPRPYSVVALPYKAG
jgi:transposase-like protein